MAFLEALPDVLQVLANFVTILGLIFVWQTLKKIREEARLAREAASNRKVKETISIKVTDDLQQKNLQYGVLHIRDGMNSLLTLVRDKEIVMQQEAGDRYSATVEFVKRLGFEFKCFAEYGNYDFEDIKALLQGAGFRQVDPDGARRRRAWFLLPEDSKYMDVRVEGQTINNYYLPD